MTCDLRLASSSEKSGFLMRGIYSDMDMDMEDSKSNPNSSNSGIDMLKDMGSTASAFSLLASLRLDPRRVL